MNTTTKQGSWEYGLLILSDGEGRNGKFFCDLLWLDSGGVHILSRKAKETWAYNPWTKALGVLGKNGWELVSVQHGNVILGDSIPVGDDSAFAYFKRPIIVE